MPPNIFFELNKIYNLNCLDGLKKLDDKSIDLVLTDPPYGINENNERNQSRSNICETTDFGHYEWDKSPIAKEYFDEIFRVSKNQMIFGGNYYTNFLQPSNCWIIWDKTGNQDKFKNDFADCELIWTSFKSSSKIFHWLWRGLYQENMGDKEKRVHPTQKPLALIQWLLENYSEQTDLILDPFCGSGTTCVASKKLSRNFVGFDINPEYCKIAEERLKNTFMTDKKFGGFFKY